ncbi:Protein-S-isoprenylcysteine O-methyltransferase [Psilocybe cubensis]|uniref:Protein-S-isoprenylcysteine O-methyltransferase n=1 Tax=Psilocybe cubensis TaxID=181762 RepID=A0ACB8GGL4_PSICU|nr:Protein-S-isoprenylcysteine O-methyltransferase [Psilocybe cubensis]KAH9474728.1 Protein-S-isoprenylcysteine O-methyltransferase [Psilocybe cubensis]
MSLAKVPIVAVLSLAFKEMLTSPHPDPPKGEEVPSASVDVSIARDIILTSSYVGQIILGTAEIATILAYTSPSSPLSQHLLSALTFPGGDPSRLRLNAFSILGAILWLAGAAIRMQSYQHMGKFFRFTVSIQKDHKLITTGPYAYVRHPSYSGLMLADIGWFLWNGSQGSWIRESGLWSHSIGRSVLTLFTVCFILSPPFVTFLRVEKEDDALKKQFGKEWLEWREKVPYRIIPGVY